MAIEIRQLVVRAVVEPRPGTAPAATAPPPASVRAPDLDLDRDELIAECVQQVLRELRKVRER